MASAELASKPRAKTPALILGGPTHTTLGVIRALARIPQCTVGAGTSHVAYCRWHRRLPGPRGDDPTPESLAGFLARLPVERMVLIPCSDAWVAAVACLEPTLAARFPASLASLEEARAPLDILHRLLPALRYRGVFNAQFKYDDRDGLFKLLEVNPRVWGGVSLPVRCGVNVVEMSYRDALGLPVEPIVEYPAGRYWIYASRDRKVCRRLFRERRLTPGAWLRTRAGAVQAIFRWDDPVPAVVESFHRLLQAVRRGLRVPPASSREIGV